MHGLSALHTRLSDPVANLFYFISFFLSNELQKRFSAVIIGDRYFEKRYFHE